MPELAITPFPEVAVALGERVQVDANVLPGTVWRINARGPGVLRHTELQQALNTALRAQIQGDFGMFRNSTANLDFDCENQRFDGGMIHTTTYTTNPPARHREADTAAARERERVRQAEARKLAIEREAAEKVARTTLERMLNEDQRAMLKKSGYFELIGNLGTRYRLHVNAYSGNVYWVDDKGTTLGNYCAHPDLTGKSLDGKRGRLPVSDSVIGQKLMLETDEVRFLRLANLFGGTYPPVVREAMYGPQLHQAIMQGARPIMPERIPERRPGAGRFLLIHGILYGAAAGFDVWAGCHAHDTASAVFEFSMAAFVTLCYGFMAKVRLRRR